MNDPSDNPLPREPSGFIALAAALLRRAKRHAEIEREVVEAVRSRRLDVVRDQRRSLLEEELERRGISRDAFWIEQKLDDLELSGLQRQARRGEAILNLGELAWSLSRSKENMHAMPEWMRPPPHASSNMPLGNADSATDSSAIVLDPNVDSLLDRAIKDAPVRASRLGATVAVWFDRGPIDPCQVTVHIGRHRIGIVAPSASRSVEAIVAEATQRGERPQAYGVLLRAEQRIPPYLLLVTLPTTG